jgi:hypothetical protein
VLSPIGPGATAKIWAGIEVPCPPIGGHGIQPDDWRFSRQTPTGADSIVSSRPAQASHQETEHNFKEIEMKPFTSRKVTSYLAMPILAAGILSGAAVTTASVANAAGGHGGTSHSAVAAGPRSGAPGGGSGIPDATPTSSLSAQTNIGATPNVFGSNRVGVQGVEPNVGVEVQAEPTAPITNRVGLQVEQPSVPAVNVQAVPSPSEPAVNVQTVNH